MAQHKKREVFLAALRQGASVTAACDAANLPRRTAYNWQRDDAEFAQQWADAEEEGTDRLEDEAFRRAVEGTKKPVGWHNGKAGGYVQEYSDTLTIFLLKGRRPDKYAERQINRNENTNKNYQISDEPLSAEEFAEQYDLGNVETAAGASKATH